MNFIINNSKPINTNSNRFVRPSVFYNIRCSGQSFCATINSVSFVTKNNKIYTNNDVLTLTQTTPSVSYPSSESFGQENTTQNIYSADPQKLRIGIF
jgi:hypothetical protein